MSLEDLIRRECKKNLDQPTLVRRVRVLLDGDRKLLKEVREAALSRYLYQKVDEVQRAEREAALRRVAEAEPAAELVLAGVSEGGAASATRRAPAGPVPGGRRPCGDPATRSRDASRALRGVLAEYTLKLDGRLCRLGDCTVSQIMMRARELEAQRDGVAAQAEFLRAVVAGHEADGERRVAEVIEAEAADAAYRRICRNGIG